jgi:hypothetical protein
MELTGSDLKNAILNTLDDTVSRFTCYDRKEDEEMPRGAIERAVRTGLITVDEMIDKFATELRKALL